MAPRPTGPEVWVLLFLALACNQVHVEPIPEEKPEPVFNFALEPASVNFGVPDLGTTVHEVVRIVNLGEVEIIVEGVQIPEGKGLSATVPEVPFITPGSYQEIVLSWDPPDTLGLSADLSMVVVGPEDEREVEVALKGFGQGAVPTLSRAEFDFGEVKVGCSADANFTLTNTGNQDLVIDELTLQGSDEYTLDEDELEPFPWVIKPFGSVPLRVVYEPTDRQTAQGLIEVLTEGVIATTTFEGLGIVDGEEHLEYVASESGLTTVLFHINEVAISTSPYGTHAERFEDGLPHFFQTLLDHHVMYRIAFVWHRDGTVYGSEDYIDQTMSANEAYDVAIEMIEGHGNYADNDASFTTLQNAVNLADDWLFEDAWADARLNLIMVNRDMEQSGGNWASYVTWFQTLKDDPDDVMFHAIAGDGTGCDGAEATTFQQAVIATGGSFNSICETDWEDNFNAMAAASMDGTPVFPLTGYPLVSTIDVAVDGDHSVGHWFYDSSLNAIAFEDGFYPEGESLVTIDYLQSVSCD